MAEWIRPWVCDLMFAGSSPVTVIAVVSLGKTLYLDCFSLPRCINGYLRGATCIYSVEPDCGSTYGKPPGGPRWCGTLLCAGSDRFEVHTLVCRIDKLPLTRG